jgi:dUTPase
MMEIPIFKFAIREDLKDTGNLFLPIRGDEKATGWDVRAAFTDRKDLIIHNGDHARIPLGFRTFVPAGWWFELKPRSSTFAKKYLHSLYGTIDETYEGELVFACQYLPKLEFGFEQGITYFKSNHLKIAFGEAIGQIIPVRRQEMVVEGISNEEFETLCQERKGTRGAGGFGSTDQ